MLIQFKIQKKLFINSNLIVTIVFLVITFAVNYSLKDESTLIKRLTDISIISIIIMLIFFGIKLNLDITYTEDKFEQFYTEILFVQ